MDQSHFLLPVKPGTLPIWEKGDNRCILLLFASHDALSKANQKKSKSFLISLLIWKYRSHKTTGSMLISLAPARFTLASFISSPSFSVLFRVRVQRLLPGLNAPEDSWLVREYSDQFGVFFNVQDFRLEILRGYNWYSGYWNAAQLNVAKHTKQVAFWNNTLLNPKGWVPIPSF